MDRSVTFDHYREYVNAQSQPARWVPSGTAPRPPAVTISRQAGCGAWDVANELVAILAARHPGPPPWTAFDRNLVQRVVDDHDLPAKVVASMPEDRVTELSDTIDGLFGLRPSSWSLVRATAETILRLAEVGHAIVIGRGGSVVTANLDNVFHVRLTASLPRRVAHVRATLELGADPAYEHVRQVDLARKRYLKKYYGRDIEDPLLYHLTINMDRFTTEEIGRVIADAVEAVIPTAARDSTPQR